jgi:hypothetical protein
MSEDGNGGRKPEDGDDDEDYSRLRRGASHPLVTACLEGRETLNQQISAVRRIDQKAIRVLRANLILIGAILTALSLVVDSSQSVSRYLNIFSIVGVVALWTSSVAAATTYLVSDVESGIGTQDIRAAVSKEMSEHEIYTRLANGYADWIRHNESAIQVNGLLGSIMIIGVVNAITYLAGGVVIGGLNMSLTYASVGSCAIVSAIMLIVSYFLYKIDAWIGYHKIMRESNNS